MKKHAFPLLIAIVLVTSLSFRLCSLMKHAPYERYEVETTDLSCPEKPAEVASPDSTRMVGQEAYFREATAVEEIKMGTTMVFMDSTEISEVKKAKTRPIYVSVKGRETDPGKRWYVGKITKKYKEKN